MTGNVAQIFQYPVKCYECAFVRHRTFVPYDDGFRLFYNFGHCELFRNVTCRLFIILLDLTAILTLIPSNNVADSRRSNCYYPISYERLSKSLIWGTSSHFHQVHQGNVIHHQLSSLMYRTLLSVGGSAGVHSFELIGLIHVDHIPVHVPILD
jgi:hypothetical protein